MILRVQPSYSRRPPIDEAARSLDEYFASDWTQHGEPQVLFIKRAARKGDRWTSHIALPGGKRELDIEDDKAAAIRETFEEVGIDLDKDAIYVGNLPQRVVTTQWGAVPLMVLCPFVFLMVTQTVPLLLQPTEVASAHWVALRHLLTPEHRTLWYEDVSNRLAKQETGLRRHVLRAMLGMMTFGAIHLQPLESHVSFESPQPLLIKRPWRHRLFAPDEVKPQAPLLLWGLTLGVLTDFLYLLPPHTALELWQYPTFTQWDVRFVIWAMTYRLRNADASSRRPGAALTSNTLEVSDLGSTITKLDAYYPLVRKAVAFTVMARAGVATSLIAWLIMHWKRR